MIPTPEECFQRMQQYGMLAHIKNHSIVVARIAEYLASELNAADGESFSLPLTVAAALLHDIGKTQCLENGNDHAQLGKEICLTHRYTELAPIVGEPVVLKNGMPGCSLSEKEIVYYADKRVNHDVIVSLEERLAYIMERYGNNDEHRHRAIERNFVTCHQIEEKIFAGLSISPAAIGGALEDFHSLLLQVA
ncbi:MAG: HDIG domain-containing protein [Deltaproteobacteria bacterium]